MSQNKIISESRVDEMSKRVEILKEEYLKKEKKLNQLVRTIDHHVP